MAVPGPELPSRHAKTVADLEVHRRQMPWAQGAGRAAVHCLPLPSRCVHPLAHKPSGAGSRSWLCSALRSGGEVPSHSATHLPFPLQSRMEPVCCQLCLDCGWRAGSLPLLLNSERGQQSLPAPFGWLVGRGVSGLDPPAAHLLAASFGRRAGFLLRKAGSVSRKSLWAAPRGAPPSNGGTGHHL